MVYIHYKIHSHNLDCTINITYQMMDTITYTHTVIINQLTDMAIMSSDVRIVGSEIYIIPQVQTHTHMHAIIYLQILSYWSMHPLHLLKCIPKMNQ